MPRAYLCELRDDVVVVAGRRESGVLWKQIAEDSGIAEASLRNWLKRADIEGSRPGQARDETDQVRGVGGGGGGGGGWVCGGWRRGVRRWVSWEAGRAGRWLLRLARSRARSAPSKARARRLA